jgi:hypothetical protein
MVVWAVTPSGRVSGYGHFGGSCCCHIQGKRWMYEVTSERRLPLAKTTRFHNPEDHSLKLETYFGSNESETPDF